MVTVGTADRGKIARSERSAIVAGAQPRIGGGVAISALGFGGIP